MDIPIKVHDKSSVFSPRFFYSLPLDGHTFTKEDDAFLRGPYTSAAAAIAAATIFIENASFSFHNNVVKFQRSSYAA